jgi:predicted aspartyl protease
MPERTARRRAVFLVGVLLVSVLPAAASGEGATAPIRYADSHDPPADALIAAIPFEEDSEPTRIMINLAPEGNAPFVMLLDTGASGSVMTPEMAREMGISIRRSKTSAYRRKTRLGRDLLFWIDTSSSDTASSSGWSVGLLGANFLKNYVLELDYPGRVVRFYDPKKYKFPKTVTAPNERIVKLRRGGTRFGVEVEIDGKSVFTLLDTGAPMGLLLSGSAAKKVGIDVDSLEEFGGVQLMAGGTETRIYETEDLRFAGFDFPLMPIVVAPRGLYNQGGNTDSAIGYDILRHFVIRLDYKKSRMWLRQAPATPVTLLGEDYAKSRVEIGMGLTEEERRELQADADLRASEAAKRFQEQNATRMFAQTPGGGWLRVEDSRLDTGPEDGETWYRFEDMQRIKAERKGPQEGLPAASSDAGSDAEQSPAKQ